MMNEYIHNIKGIIQQAAKTNSESTCLQCKFRLESLGKEGDPTYIELKEKKKNLNEFVKGGTNSIFSLGCAKNYLVLISKTCKIEVPKVNNNTFDLQEFFFIGFLLVNETKFSESPRAMIKVSPTKFHLKFGDDWHDCYVTPIDKITTMIR